MRGSIVQRLVRYEQKISFVYASMYGGRVGLTFSHFLHRTFILSINSKLDLEIESNILILALLQKLLYFQNWNPSLPTSPRGEEQVRMIELETMKYFTCKGVVKLHYIPIYDINLENICPLDRSSNLDKQSKTSNEYRQSSAQNYSQLSQNFTFKLIKII